MVQEDIGGSVEALEFKFLFIVCADIGAELWGPILHKGPTVELKQYMIHWGPSKNIFFSLRCKMVATLSDCCNQKAHFQITICEARLRW